MDDLQHSSRPATREIPETVKLWIGKVERLPDGRANDMRRPVEFEGEKLAEVTTYRQRKGSVTGPRRTTETLYRTEDGRLLVYAQEWSRCHGETEHHSMQQVMAEHLEPGGRFSALGRAAGM